MQAFVSLHTSKPSYQLHHEVQYEGYHRIPVEYSEEFALEPLNITFPVIEQDSPDVVTYIAIGACSKGQGAIFMCIPALPNIPLLTAPERQDTAWWIRQGCTLEQAEQNVVQYGHTAPRVCICNTDPVRLPTTVNPIARIAHQLIFSGLMSATDLHPRLYEAINDALHNAGVPIIPVVRQGAGDLKGKLSDLRLGDWGHA